MNVPGQPRPAHGRALTGAIEHELDATAGIFGVRREQVQRDHAISHVLSQLSSALPDRELTFIGGTALARTHLTDSRLSEDIDLVTSAKRTEVAERIEEAAIALSRRFGRPQWSPSLVEVSESEAGVLRMGGVALRVQLLRAEGRPPWPTEMVSLHQRYSDAPEARMRVLTADAFAADKLTALLDRRSPRDLHDLWALGRRGLITPAAAGLFARHGAFSDVPDLTVLCAPPREDAWHRELAHQTRLNVTASRAAAEVAERWAVARRGMLADRAAATAETDRRRDSTGM